MSRYLTGNSSVYAAYGTACWHAFLTFFKNYALARSFALQKA